MVSPRSALLLCVVLGAAVGTQAQFFGRGNQQIETPVVFFEDKDLDGDHINYPVILPPEGGCAECNTMVRSVEDELTVVSLQLSRADFARQSDVL